MSGLRSESYAPQLASCAGLQFLWTRDLQPASPSRERGTSERVQKEVSCLLYVSGDQKAQVPSVRSVDERSLALDDRSRG